MSGAEDWLTEREDSGGHDGDGLGEDSSDGQRMIDRSFSYQTLNNLDELAQHRLRSDQVEYE